MIFLALLLVLIFSISSVSSASIDGFDDVKDNKVLKSNALSSNLNSKSTTLSTSTKAKANTAKAANVTKKNTSKTAVNAKTNKTNATTVNRKTLAKTSASFMNSVEKNGKFPKVKISNKNYSNTEYLYLISKAVENESNSKIEIKNNLVKPYENTKIKSVKGTINKTEYVKIASKTRIFIEKNKRGPNWASSSKGNIPYNQLVLLFSKCLDSYNKTNKLPNSVKLDDLDLEKIKNKINKTAKSTTKSSVKKNTTKKTTNSTKKATTKSSVKKNTTKKTTNSSAKKNTTKKTTNSTKKATAKTTKNTGTNTVGNANNKNSSLVEKTMDYVHNILNNILDKLDPSKYKVDVSKTDEAKAKVNTSKINVDVSGKSSVNLKISAKDAKTATKKTTANNSKKATAKKTTVNTKKSANKTVSKVSKAKDSISNSLKKYLVSSKNCQVSNKEIQKLAKTLTSSLKSDYEKGKKVFAWVRDNIQYKKYSNTRSGAVKTLQSKKGNCVDQSHLLIALSRASGIPARYVNGGNCKFNSGYVSGHVWAQMYINNKWMVADPTGSKNTLGKINNWNTKSYTKYGEYSSISF